jgi:hypothetical protein
MLNIAIFFAWVVNFFKIMYTLYVHLCLTQKTVLIFIVVTYSINFM